MQLATPPVWWGQEAVSPVIAVAVHAGHGLRPEIVDLVALEESDRLREEDPYTDSFTTLAPTRLVAGRSRFEVDLNRPVEEAVYERPDQSWGMQVWTSPPSPAVVANSRAAHDVFYAALAGVLDRAERSFGRFVVYDLHSYNHRREGPDGPTAPQAENPDINLGTGSMTRERWAPLVDAFLDSLRKADVPTAGGHLDVRENVRFGGGHLARWVHQRYPETGCALAVEVKKFFMDECTGVVDPGMLDAVGAALAGTVPDVLSALKPVER